MLRCYTSTLCLQCGLHLEWFVQPHFTRFGSVRAKADSGKSLLLGPSSRPFPPVSSIWPVSPCMLFNDTVLKISFKKGGKRDCRRSLPPQTGCRERSLKATAICYLNAPVTDHQLSVARAKHTPACPAGSLCDEAQASDCACVCAGVWVGVCVSCFGEHPHSSSCEECYRHGLFQSNR